MRTSVLLAFLSTASADVDPATIASGEWGLRLFLQFGTGGGGAWEEAKVGAVARYETASSFSLPYVDPLGGKRKENPPKLSQHEIRVVKRDDGQLMLQTRGRPSNERGEPGKWGKPRTSELRVTETKGWKVERLGDTTYRLGSSSVAATAYRARFPDRNGAEAEESWTVVVAGGLGVLQAKQESGDEIEWNLVRADVEVKVDGRKLRCRSYQFRWNPPAEFEHIAVKERHLLLCEDVPGRVVRQTYSPLVGTTVQENLISFQGR